MITDKVGIEGKLGRLYERKCSEQQLRCEKTQKNTKKTQKNTFKICHYHYSRPDVLKIKMEKRRTIKWMTIPGMTKVGLYLKPAITKS